MPRYRLLTSKLVHEVYEVEAENPEIAWETVLNLEIEPVQQSSTNWNLEEHERIGQ